MTKFKIDIWLIADIVAIIYRNDNDHLSEYEITCNDSCLIIFPEGYWNV